MAPVLAPAPSDLRTTGRRPGRGLLIKSRERPWQHQILHGGSGREGKKEKWEQSLDLGTVTVQLSLGVRKLQAVMTDRVGVAPQQNSALLARPRRQRRVPLDDGADLAAAVLAVVVAALPAPSLGWGVDGHLIICQIAQVHLAF